jgi:hypothetical protein
MDHLFKQMAIAALGRDSLLLRELVLDFLSQRLELSLIQQPRLENHAQLVVIAALLELFATRLGQLPPAWTKDVVGGEPFFLLAAAEKMPRLRRLCELEAPEPLRKRLLYAPPNFLEFA